MTFCWNQAWGRWVATVLTAVGASRVRDQRAFARMKSSTTGAIRVRHLLPLKMP